jgi:hypothetical protein
MRTSFILAACIILFSAVGTSAAEVRAWFLSARSLSQVAVLDNGRTWSPVMRLDLPVHFPQQPIVFDGGRYLVWGAYRPEAFVLVRYDTRTHAIALFPSLSIRNNVWMAVDRVNDRLVALDTESLYLLDVANLRVLGSVPTPITPVGFDAVSLGVANGLIFIGHHSQYLGGGRTFVLDAMSGALLQTVERVWQVEVARDESRVYLQGLDHAQGPAVVQMWDPRTVTPIATVTTDRFIDVIGGVAVSTIVAPQGDTLEVRAHEPTMLDICYRVVVPLPHYPYSLDLLEPSPSSPVVLRTGTCVGISCHSSIRVYDRATLSFAREMWDAPFDVAGSALVMLAPPDAPTNVRAEAVDGGIRLAWNPPPDVGDYEVAAGLAPGVYNIGTVRTGGAAFLRVPNVPAGTYYVRVRAINELGSAYSAELRVDVP